MAAPNKLTWPQRIRKRAAETNDQGCWLWPANQCNNYGYGTMRVTMADGRLANWSAHRWSYTVHVGPIPDGLTIDHLCRNTRCVNPAHLEAVTMGENQRRALPSLGATCARGHLRSEHGYTNSQGRPACRECARETWAVVGRKRQRAGMLTTGQVAQRIGRSVHWFSDAVSSGKFPQPDRTTVGGQRLWAEATVDAWLAQRDVAA